MAAPNFKLEVHKSRGAEKWANAYLLIGADMDDAQATAEAIVTFERQFHRDVVLFDYYLLSTITPGDRIFRHVSVNLTGIILTGSNQYLPLFCTVRVDFNTIDSDPARKYYRRPILEDEQINGLIIEADADAMQDVVDTYFFGGVAGDNVVTPAGNVVVSSTVHRPVQERQLTRRKRPRIAP